MRSHPRNRLLQPLPRIPEPVQHHVGQAAPRKLRDGAEGSRVKHDIADDRKRWKGIQQDRHGVDVDYPICGGIQDEHIERLATDDGFYVLPGRRDKKIRLREEDVTDVREKLGRQINRDAQVGDRLRFGAICTL